MEKLIKLIKSPSDAGIETIDDKMVIKLHIPSSENNVTIQINPFLQDYKENIDQPNAQIRQALATSTTPNTKTMSFDLKNNSSQSVNIEGINYKITLMNIGKEKTSEGDFPYFEFLVKKG